MSNLAALLKKQLDTPERILYSQFENDVWRDYTAGEVAGLAARWQQAFRENCCEKGDRVALCIKNSVNWVAIDQAALGLGLVVVPLYVSDNPESVAWCISNSDTRLLVLDNMRMLETIGRTLEKPPIIVCLQGGTVAPAVSVADWLSKTAGLFEVMELEPDALASIIYTSGTTGRPKGVKLSHRNILVNVEAMLQIVKVHDTDSLLSVLPLSHTFERTCGYYAPLAAGAKVAYARGIAQLAEDLATHRPTILIAVPRVFERFLARVEEKLSASRAKKVLFRLTVKLGWRMFKHQATWAERLLYIKLHKLVAAPILARLGGNLRLAVVGGAAVEARISQAFVGLGLPLIQGYGLTEASPVVAANCVEDNEPFSVGRPLPGVAVCLNEAHELLVKAPSVMLGYWRNPEATAAVLSEDGWLNTGDQADIHDGRIYIKGRTKDILVLSNGEKLPPGEVEMAILDDPVFEQVMVVGEGKPYLVLLAVAQETDEKVLLARANAQLKHFPRWVRVRRVAVFREPWTVEAGLLTPTLKVKRNVVVECFKKRIEQAYRI
jgi:long-chain acyl-CoA synthetase